MSDFDIRLHCLHSFGALPQQKQNEACFGSHYVLLLENLEESHTCVCRDYLNKEQLVD